MKRAIEKLRHEYGNKPLLEKDLESDPVAQFHRWLEEAIEAHVMEPNGVNLATVSPSGRPASRTILLKGVDRKGNFLFFTNYGSRKGVHLEKHPFGSLTFWWKELYRQITVEGRVTKVSRKETLVYFRKRPRGAQLAALASSQSSPLASRIELEECFARLKKRYVGKTIPCPKMWGGYRLLPDRFELWQGRKDRLHDRFLYVQTNGEWVLTRLSP